MYIYSVHVQWICDSLDIPYFETHPVLKNQFHMEERKLEFNTVLTRQTRTYHQHPNDGKIVIMDSQENLC